MSTRIKNPFSCPECDVRAELDNPNVKWDKHYVLPHHLPSCSKARSRKQTCETCGKVRKCWVKNRWRHYCSECWPLTDEQRSEVYRQRRAERKPASRFAYPIIGGPLDGEYATTFDFYRGGVTADSGGIYAAHATEYAEFNAAGGGRRRIGGSPSMVFLHKSLLRPLISPRER